MQKERSMLTGIIANNKIHAIYIGIILCLLICYSLCGKQPKETIVTQTVTKTEIKYVDRIVLKNNNVAVDRTTTTESKDGSKTTVVEHSVDLSTINSQTIAKIQNQTTETKTEITRYQSNYQLSLMIPVKPFSGMYPNPLDTRFTVGMRVFSLPVFLNAGSTVRFNEFTLGLTLEI